MPGHEREGARAARDATGACRGDAVDRGDDTLDPVGVRRLDHELFGGQKACRQGAESLDLGADADVGEGGRRICAVGEGRCRGDVYGHDDRVVPGHEGEGARGTGDAAGTGGRHAVDRGDDSLQLVALRRHNLDRGRRERACGEHAERLDVCADADVEERRARVGGVGERRRRSHADRDDVKVPADDRERACGRGDAACSRSGDAVHGGDDSLDPAGVRGKHRDGGGRQGAGRVAAEGLDVVANAHVGERRGRVRGVGEGRRGRDVDADDLKVPADDRERAGRGGGAARAGSRDAVDGGHDRTAVMPLAAPVCGGRGRGHARAEDDDSGHKDDCSQVQSLQHFCLPR